MTIPGFKHFVHHADYEMACPVGEWTGNLDHMAWGKNQNLILYFTDINTQLKYRISVFVGNTGNYETLSHDYNFRDDGVINSQYTLITRHTKSGYPALESAVFQRLLLFTNKVLKKWKIAPVKGGGICLVGYLDDELTQSSNIVKVRKGEVQTSTGTTYSIASTDMEVGVWQLQLQFKRPVQYGVLVKNEIL